MIHLNQGLNDLCDDGKIECIFFDGHDEMTKVMLKALSKNCTTLSAVSQVQDICTTSLQREVQRNLVKLLLIIL